MATPPEPQPQVVASKPGLLEAAEGDAFCSDGIDKTFKTVGAGDRVRKSNARINSHAMICSEIQLGSVKRVCAVSGLLHMILQNSKYLALTSILLRHRRIYVQA
eukprot:4233833-Ditylum_brightwellii.AAC.1